MVETKDDYVNNELEPLEQWYCDNCGKVINSAKDGWLEWYRDNLPGNNLSKAKGFRIVHYNRKCMYDDQKLIQDDKLIGDRHLPAYTGSNGLVSLLSKIQTDYVENNQELVGIIYRLQVPYYEEARRYHNIAEQDGYFQGENELTRYLTETSINILNNYK